MPLGLWWLVKSYDLHVKLRSAICQFNGALLAGVQILTFFMRRVIPCSTVIDPKPLGWVQAAHHCYLPTTDWAEHTFTFNGSQCDSSRFLSWLIVQHPTSKARGIVTLKTKSVSRYLTVARQQAQIQQQHICFCCMLE